LGVSLVAVAAIAVSLLITRQRSEKTGLIATAPSGESTPVDPSLVDAIRSAGL